MTIALFVIASVTLLVGVAALKRYGLVSADLARRSAHLGAGGINLLAPLFVSPTAIILVNGLFALTLFVGRGSGPFNAIQTTVRKSYGDLCFPLGITLAAVVLLPDHLLAYQYGVAVMGIADALAGLVGERWGRRGVNILGTHKTFVGAGVFYGTSLLITIAFLPALLPAVFLLPLLLTVVEFGAVYGTDNLILPLTAGGLFVLLV